MKAHSWVGAGTALIMAVTGVAHATPEAAARRDDRIVLGHRGSPGQAPEETVASYRDAVRAKADVLEGDVQLTADGQAVLVHDDTLARTTDAEQVFPDRAPWRVGQFTLAEIRRLDAGSWFDTRYAGQRVATLAELLEIAKRERVGLTLELKSPANSPGVGTKLAAELTAAGLADGGRLRSGAYKAHVHSRDQAALREFHTGAPKVPLSYLTGGAMPDDTALDSLKPWTMGVYAHPRVTSAADVARAHARGLKVISDPVDSPAEISMAVGQGYDWVASNFPGTVRRVLDGRDPFPPARGVVVDSVVADAAGDDVQPERGEHVVLRNTTARPVRVGGGYLRDQAGNLMRIGADYTVQPGSLLRVYVGPGTNTSTAYYNGGKVGFLNNTGGDTISFFNADHALLDIHSYILP
ncbi:glycerophosphodiester phosphodiesterase family protein [Spirillospora sp. NPDC050679]